MRLIIGLWATCLILVACKTKQPETPPGEILQSFLNALQRNDLATAKKLATQQSEFTLNFLEMGMSQMDDTLATNTFRRNISSIRIGNSTVENDTARVQVTVGATAKQGFLQLIKINNEWKVDFSPNGLQVLKFSDTAPADKAVPLTDSIRATLNPSQKKVIEALKKYNEKKHTL